MLEVIAKTQRVGNESAGVNVSGHFEKTTNLDERVQIATEIEGVLRALKDTYHDELLLASLAVFGEDVEE